MNRLEFGAILATVLLFIAISVIRRIVVPIVRRRAASYRTALTAPSNEGVGRGLTKGPGPGDLTENCHNGGHA